MESSSLQINCQVRVGVRIRPLTSKECAAGGKSVVACDPFTNTVELSTCRFTYDTVLDSSVTQTQLYQTVSAPLLNSFLDGYNATVSTPFS
jgi:Kinesin motor domain